MYVVVYEYVEVFWSEMSYFFCVFVDVVGVVSFVG